jgi:chromosomal replication initiation ATPase DnaA
MPPAANDSVPDADAVIRVLAARGLVLLLDSVCRSRGVTREELCGRCRVQSATRARQELWWRIRYLPDRDYSYSEIARMLGRDHTTVLHGALAHERRARDAISSFGA